MQVTDSERYAVAMTKLAQARTMVNEATKIIEYLFKSEDQRLDMEIVSCSLPINDNSISNLRDPVTGLYPGQKQDSAVITEQKRLEKEDPSAECVE